MSTAIYKTNICKDKNKTEPQNVVKNIRGISETSYSTDFKTFQLSRLAFKPKDRERRGLKPGTADKIHCNGCDGADIGETGRNLIARQTEHNKVTTKKDPINNITEHHKNSFKS